MKFPKIRKKPGQKLKEPDEVKQSRPPMSFEERLTQFRSAGLDDIKIRVHRDRGASDAQRGYLTTQWTVGEVCDHGNFHDLVSEASGGGDFHAEFLEDLQPMKTGDGKVEKYQFAISGKPKKQKEKETKGKGEMSSAEFLEKLLSANTDTIGGRLAMRIIGSDNGNDLEKAAEVLLKLKQLVPEPESMNPLEMLESFLGIIQKISEQIKPPPVTTQGQSGFWSALATQLGPTISNILTSQQPAQIPQQTGQPGFAGTGQVQQQQIPQQPQYQQPQYEQPQQPQQNKVIEMPQQKTDSEGEAEIKPFAKLHAMWMNKNVSDEDLAVFAVEVIDSYVKFQMGGSIPPQYRNLLEDPGAALDLLFGLLPVVEFRDKAKLKELGTQFIEQWKAQSASVQQGIDDVSGEQVQQDPSDGGTGSTEDDQDEDQDG